MKSKFLPALCLGLVILACNKDRQTATPSSHQTGSSHHYAQRFSDSTESSGSQFISMNTANAMISSYLTSLGGSANDTDVRSFSVNADQLRAYLADSSVK